MTVLMKDLRNSAGTLRLSCQYSPGFFEGSGETFGHSLETRTVRVCWGKKGDLLRCSSLIQQTLFFPLDPKAPSKIGACYKSYSLVYNSTDFQAAEH